MAIDEEETNLRNTNSKLE